MPSSIEPATVVVTGAAAGIGRSTAVHLACAGYRVVAADIDREGLAGLRADMHPATALTTRPLDIGDHDQVAALFSDPDVTRRLYGSVLCAGVTRRSSLTETSAADAETLTRTNLLGTLHGIQATAAALDGRPGSVVVITSINAVRPLPSQAVYSATKAALESLVASAAVELGPRGVRVNAIAPGAIVTAMNPGLGPDDPLAGRIPLRRLGRPSDIAGAVACLLGDAGAYISGATLTVDGGLLHVR